MKQKNIFQKKERSTKLLRNISHTYIAVNTGQSKMKNKSEDKNMFLQNDADNTIEWTYQPRQGFREDGSKKEHLCFSSEKDKLKFRGDNEEKMRGKFDTHR